MTNSTGEPVAKKPKQQHEAKPPDRHKSGFMVRLPESYRSPLANLKVKTRRTTTVEVQMAIDEHLKREGIKPPGSS